jgi:hypothetical protein
MVALLGSNQPAYILYRARIFKLLKGPRIDSKESIPPACSLTGRNDNPLPTRFLAPIDCLKIPALETFRNSYKVHPSLGLSSQYSDQYL